MSGQLVGEVLAASDQLRGSGLHERGFHALVAIAEKCETASRQGSVRWDHIRAGLYGASLSTAKRAVADLKSAGVIRVVKRGFNNQNGVVHAPIYEIGVIGEQVTQVTHSVGSEQVTQVTHSVGSEQVTQVTHSVGSEQVTQVTHSVPDRTGQIGDRTGQIGDRTGHPGDLLDGSIDGSIDGGRACAGETPPTPEPRRPRNAPEPPSLPTNGNAARERPRCARHAQLPSGTPIPNCPDCAAARHAIENQDRIAAERIAAERAAIRQAINNCRDCDDYARLNDLTDCPKHANFRTALLQPSGVFS